MTHEEIETAALASGGKVTRNRLQEMLAEQQAPAKKAAGKKAKRNKYHNRKVEHDGYKFDSEAEAQRWKILRLLEETGHIQDLRRQVPLRVRWPATGELLFKYVADFTYVRGGRLVVEDVKSEYTAKTDYYRLKKKIVRIALGIEIQEVIKEKKQRGKRNTG